MNEESKNQKQVRRKFSPEFKDQVLLRAEKDGVATVAADLGVKESMIFMASQTKIRWHNT